MLEQHHSMGGEELQIDLTIEEALGLLDLLLLCPAELSDNQRSALQKLSRFCRIRLMAETEASQ